MINERGKLGELIAQKWLIHNGYIVVPTSDIDNGGAPMLLERFKNIILPDNIVFHAGQTAFVEVKTYQKAEWEQKRQRWHHGILQRHYEHYRQAARDCGIPCYLAIVQVNVWKLLLGELECLSKTMLPGLGPSKFGWEVYFDINSFEWFSLDELNVLRLPDLPPLTARPWDAKVFPSAKQGRLKFEH